MEIEKIIENIQRRTDLKLLSGNDFGTPAIRGSPYYEEDKLIESVKSLKDINVSAPFMIVHVEPLQKIYSQKGLQEFRDSLIPQDIRKRLVVEERNYNYSEKEDSLQIGYFFIREKIATVKMKNSLEIKIEPEWNITNFEKDLKKWMNILKKTEPNLIQSKFIDKNSARMETELAGEVYAKAYLTVVPEGICERGDYPISQLLGEMKIYEYSKLIPKEFVSSLKK